ncbi:MAG TPA: 2-dehydropantoate 2-reductase [Anaeromyxobacter sp.]|nr:2-dehydropantoate 2-reductase [Anaeromyxobacter sp.]
MDSQSSCAAKILVVGAGALGGLIAARLRASGRTVRIATKDAQTAAKLKASGLHVSGVGGAVSVEMAEIAPLDAYGESDAFDLVVLATKARDAMQVAPKLVRMLGRGGVLLPIQNGGVSQALADHLGLDRILGGLSNLGATMNEPGYYEQRNAGHLLVGELSGGDTARAERVRQAMSGGVEVRVTTNLRGAIWSKLLLNCSVTTIGAIAGRTMREYIALPHGRRLFDLAYDEALTVALASGVHPQRMLVEPIPPGWSGHSVPGEAHDAWLRDILASYGDVKPSMLQDFERGRPTEIDFINGYVADVGRTMRIPTPANAAIVETVYAITRGELRPDPSLLSRTLGSLG